MVKKERSGKVFGVGGNKSDEYTEKYREIEPGMKSLERFEHGHPMTIEDKKNIRMTNIVLQDLRPSKYVKKEIKRFDKVLKTRLTPEGCPVHSKYNPKTKKCEGLPEKSSRKSTLRTK